MHDALATILTGTNCHSPQDDFCAAVAERFNQISGNAEFDHRDDNDPRCQGFGFCYDGSRCLAENLGWRLRQDYATDETTPEAIRAGECDDLIVENYHSAASSENWYRFHKDWG